MSLREPGQKGSVSASTNQLADCLDVSTLRAQAQVCMNCLCLYSPFEILLATFWWDDIHPADYLLYAQGYDLQSNYK